MSVSILFLIIAASTFSRMLALSELPQDMAAFMSGTGLGMFGFLAAYLLLLVVLGTLLDSTSIMLIMLPLALPVAAALGANLVWFGVITTIAIEIGLLTPPFGLSVVRDQSQHGRPAHQSRDDFPRRVSVRADHAGRDDPADGVSSDQPRSVAVDRASLVSLLAAACQGDEFMPTISAREPADANPRRRARHLTTWGIEQ